MIKLRSMITDKPDKDGTYMVTNKERTAFAEFSLPERWAMPETFRGVKIIDTFWVDIVPPHKPYKFHTVKMTRALFPGYLKNELPLMLESTLYDESKNELQIKSNADVFTTLNLIIRECEENDLKFDSIYVRNEEDNEALVWYGNE
jgi:hypothetical protein